MAPKKRIALPDSNWYLHRAFHTPGTLSKTDPDSGWENAVAYTAVGMMCKDATRLTCKHFCAFVDGVGSYRYEIFPDYKKGRGSNYDPEDLEGMVEASAGGAIPAFLKICADLGLPTVQYPRYEADDLFASFVALYPLIPEDRVFIITHDKDMFQLVNEQVVVYTPGNKHRPERFVSLKTLGDLRFNLTPSRFLDYQTLIGDSVDAIPSIMSSKKALAILQDPTYTNMKAWFKTELGAKILSERHDEIIRNRMLVKLNKKAFEDALPSITPVFPKVVPGKVPAAYAAYRTFASSRTKSLF